jgi:hypothetical protein
MMTIVFVSQKDEWTNAVAFGVINYLLEEGQQVKVYDLSDFETPFPNWLRNRLMHKISKNQRNSPSRLLQKSVEDLGVPYYTLKTSNTNPIENSLDLEISRYLQRFMSNPEGAQTWHEYSGTLGPSIYSSWVTTIALDDKPDPMKHVKQIRNQIELFLTIERIVRYEMKHEDDATGYVFNGRLPLTAAIVGALKSADKKVFYYEYAPPTYRIFLEEFRPHSRVQTQENASRVTADLNQERRKLVAETYLKNRRNNTSINKFLIEGSNTATEGISNSGKPIAAIFTSSPDEMVGVGDEWSWGELESQEKAINLASHRLLGLGYEVIIRIHPNMINKSWKLYRREIKLLSSYATKLIRPLEEFDSYNLIEEANIVITCGSTIGLESIAMGKPTFQLGPSFYDLLTDVKRIGSIEEIQSCTFEEYVVSPKETTTAVVSLLRANSRVGEQKSIEEFLESTIAYQKKMKIIDVFLKSIFVIPTLFILLNRSPKYLANVLLHTIGRKRTAALFKLFE